MYNIIVRMIEQLSNHRLAPVLAGVDRGARGARPAGGPPRARCGTVWHGVARRWHGTGPLPLGYGSYGSASVLVLAYTSVVVRGGLLVGPAGLGSGLAAAPGTWNVSNGMA